MSSTMRILVAGVTMFALAAPLAAHAAGGVGFSLVPVGTNSYFVYDTRPGQTTVGQLGLVSRANRAQTILMRAVDVATAATGGLDYGLGAPRRVGDWLALARHSIVLGPGEVVNVPFEVHVPDGARPGDHLAGLVAYEPTERQAESGGGALRLRFRSRLAVAVQLRLAGRRRPHLFFRGADIVESPSGIRVLLRLANDGNVLVKRTEGHVAVSQDGQELVDAPVRIDTFAPDSEIRYPLALPGTPVQGTYHLAGTLKPTGAPRVRIAADVELTAPQARRFEEATGQEVLRRTGTSPLRLVLMLVPLLIAAVFAVAYWNARALGQARLTDQ
jgi:hypothetical protein